MNRQQNRLKKVATIYQRRRVNMAAAVILCAILIVPIMPPSLAQGEEHHEQSVTSFATSFESGQAQPQKNNVRTIGNSDVYWFNHGKRMSGMKINVSRGPSEIYTSAAHFGWTGKRVLYYSGQVQQHASAEVQRTLFHTHIRVKTASVLSYYLAPLASKNELSTAANNVSIDLAFSDGTFLHQYKQVTDEEGFAVTPSAQGASGTLLTNQWNHKQIAIGKAAHGKTITAIILCYKPNKATRSFRGAIDNLLIAPVKAAQTTNPLDAVNILRGTASNSQLSRGNTLPAVGVPNGFAYWSPATNSSSARHFYPYQQNNNPDNQPTIQSFSLSHSANVTDGDRQSFQVMPSDVSGTPSANRLNRGLAFSRTREIARPDLYQVTFTNGIQAKMTALSHSAILRFRFKGNSSNLIFDNIDNNGALTLSPDKKVLYGYSDVTNGKTGEVSRLFFYATVDQPVIDQGHLYGQGRDKVTGFYKFDTTRHKSVTMRIASSLISVDQARHNLNLEVGSHVSFNDARLKAAAAWTKRLRRVSVTGASTMQRTTLYSNLYRLYLSPNSLSENTGTAKKPTYHYADLAAPLKSANYSTATGAWVRSGVNYNSADFQYTAQTVWPAYEWLEPRVASKILNCYLRALKDNDAQISASEAPYVAMTLADASLKNLPGLSKKAVYYQILKEASNRLPLNPSARQDQSDSLLSGTSLSLSASQSASHLLADSQRDYAIAMLAEALAKGTTNTSYTDDAVYYLKQAQNYLFLFTTGMHRPSHVGLGSNAFMPAQLLRNANPQLQMRSWHLDFDVPQDGQGLANQYRGQTGLAAKMDQWIAAVPTAKEIADTETAKEAASGGLGALTLANPQSPSFPYMYLFTGEPGKTATIVRQLLNRFYTGSDSGQGYLGDDTDGMLSAFYIFAAAGIYPLQKGSGNFVLNTPLFKRMTVHPENGETLTIEAPAVSNKNRYIQSVIFNGQTYANASIPESMLTKGGDLFFVTGSSPSAWASSSSEMPVSITPVSTNGSTIYPKPFSNLLNTEKVQLTTNNNIHTDFLINGSSLPASTNDALLQADFTTQSPMVRMYTLTSSENSGTGDPKSWILYGSTDGKTWDPIDSRKNESFPWHLMTRSFQIKNPQPFRYYRLRIIEASNQHALSLGAWQLLGYGNLTSDFNRVERHFLQLFVRDALSENEMTALSALMNKAETAYQSNDIPAAISYLQIYVQTIMAFTQNDSSNSTVQNQLKAEGHALINLLAP
ncbi:MAG: GH92 family glycosyl hydrolase [Sporolactobacillus sp.]